MVAGKGSQVRAFPFGSPNGERARRELVSRQSQGPDFVFLG
jgi:hypothetical protein